MTKKTLTSAKYHLWDIKNSWIIFYAIYISIIAIMVIFTTFLEDKNSMNFIASEMSSVIFIFIAGLNSFKPIFHFSLANSISRKTFFKGFLVSILPVAGVMALIETIISFVLARLLPPYTSLYSLYGSRYQATFDMKSLTSNIQYLFESFLWLFFLFCFAMLIGFFITTLYYNMNKILKFVVSFSIPILFLYVLPILDVTFWNNQFYKNLFSFLLSASGLKTTPQPYMGMLSLLIGGAILSGLSFLLIRRATVKQD